MKEKARQISTVCLNFLNKIFFNIDSIYLIFRKKIIEYPSRASNWASSIPFKEIINFLINFKMCYMSINQLDLIVITLIIIDRF